MLSVRIYLFGCFKNIHLSHFDYFLKKTIRIAYCDNDCRNEHWPLHKHLCRRVPELAASKWLERNVRISGLQSVTIFDYEFLIYIYISFHLYDDSKLKLFVFVGRL